MEELTQKEAEIFDKVKLEIEEHKAKKFQNLPDQLKKEILENFNLKLFYVIKITFANFKWPKYLVEIVKYNQRGKRAEGDFLFADDKELSLAKKYAQILTIWQVWSLIRIKRALKSGISSFDYFDNDLKEEILKNKNEEFFKIVKKEFPDLKISDVEVIWNGGNQQIRGGAN